MRLIGLLLVAALCCGRADAQVPRQIQYQGYLTAPGGSPVNAVVKMTFGLYNAAAGGTALYSETQNSVTVSNGVFNVLIGSVSPIPGSVPFDVPYWLGVAVGTDAEMTPRQPLAANAYALRSAIADSLATTATVAAAQLPALTGDVTTTAGSATTALAAVNATPGTFGDATHVGQFTVNGKGLVTSATSVAIAGSGASGSASGDLSGTYPGPTVAQVGGVTAANVAAGATLANAATASNTAGTIVRRDASGNIAAGTVTASLAGNVTGNVNGNVSGNLTGNVTGNVNGNVSGNAATATKLATARAINGVAFDGTADVTLPISGTITGTFTQPAVNANTASLPVSSSAWMIVGQVVLVATGGYYRVVSLPDATHVVLANLGVAGNTAPSTTGNGGAISPAGPVGASGLKSLVAMTTEAAGANCAYGGTRVTSGIDLDSSSTLDAGEVSATSYVCNGTPYAVVPTVPAGCGTQPVSIGTPAYVTPQGPGAIAYREDAIQFSVTVTDPNTCNSVVVAPNYIWTLVSKPQGSTASLSSTSSASPSLTPDVAGGTYQVSVQVIDTLGNRSPTTSVSLNVSPCGAQPPVISLPSIPGSMYTSTTASLGVTASSPDNQNNVNPGGAGYCPARFAKTLGYQWSIIGAPANGNAQLSSAVLASPSFYAGTVVGTYTVRVVVSDNAGLSSAPVSAQIPVSLCGTAALTWPVANAVQVAVSDPDPASPAGQANVGTQVALSPSATDPNACNGVVVTQAYQWAMLSAPNGSTAKPTTDAAGIARFVPDLPGTYQLQVTATDSLGNSSAPYTTSITTSSCGANPVSVSAQADAAALPAGATSGTAIPVTTGSSNGMSLVNGSAASADNVPASCPVRFGTTFSYAWSIVNAPPASTAQLSSVNGTTTTFLAGATPGIYQVRVVASASNGQSSPPSYVFFQVN